METTINREIESKSRQARKGRVNVSAKKQKG